MGRPDRSEVHEEGEPWLELLRRARAGDDDALNDLLSRVRPIMRHWATGRVPAGVSSLLDTGDLVQEALIACVRNLGSLEVRTEGELLGYFRTAVNNRIVDVYRRAKRRPSRAELPGQAQSHDASPLEEAIGAETLDRYEQSLAQLSDEDRQAVILRGELGLPYDEIARRMGKSSPDAARKVATRAIAKLSDLMG